VRGEKDGNLRVDRGVAVDEAVGEGLDEGGLFGPLFDKGEIDFRRGLVRFEGGHQGAAIEADRGAGVLRREADGDETGNAVGADLADDVCYIRMPVAHAGVDMERCSGGGEGLLEQMGLREGPAGERWSFVAGGFAESDLGVAMLKFFHNFFWKAAAAGDFGEVFGHFAEDVGRSVGEEQDGCGVGLGHAWIIVYCPPPPRGIYTFSLMLNGLRLRVYLLV
jgi:hypothetical protein